MARRNRVPESVSMEMPQAYVIHETEKALQDEVAAAEARAERGARQQAIKESGLPPAVYEDARQGGAKPIFPVEELILTAPAGSVAGRLVGKSASAIGKMLKTSSPKAVPVNRVIPGKNTTMQMTNVHNLSPESMQKVAANDGMLINPSANIQAKGGRGWILHTGGDVARSGGSSPESTFIVDLGKPSPDGFARGTDMFTSTVKSHLRPDGTLKPAAERYAAYAREKMAKQAGSANAYTEVKRRLDEIRQKGISDATADNYVRPYSSGQVGLDLTGVQPNLSSPAVQSMRATATTSDLVSTIEATGTQSSADELITASMQPIPFGERLKNYSSILRGNKAKLNPKDARSLYSSLENTRVEAQQGIVSDLTEHRIAKAGTVEYKPAGDISLKGRTVIYTGDDARKMVPTLQKQFPDTKFIDGGNHPAQAAPIIDEKFETFMDAKGGNTRSDAGGSKATETFDTPIPKELQARYDAWYAQLPENLQYTGDYDLQGAWLEKLGQPDRYEAAQNGHLDDYGKKPNHITFSTGSKWHDPKVPERTGGEWRQAKDGSWDFYPGTGNKASDDELKAYFDKYEKGNRVHKRDGRKREVHEDAKGGDTGPAENESIPEPGGASVFSPAGGGPRIVINPSTFRNGKDALCVAFNEAFRLVMEEMGFNPVAEPTEAQRRFFSDTAYRDDELQLRRTILARICTFDTSVKDPTDEQLQEAVEFLTSVMEAGAPQNEWEQQAVMRLRDVIAKVAEKGVPNRGQRAESSATDSDTDRGSTYGGTADAT